MRESQKGNDNQPSGVSNIAAAARSVAAEAVLSKLRRSSRRSVFGFGNIAAIITAGAHF
jgi:hypothetical protein